MIRMDGRVSDLINRFALGKPEGVELIPWATGAVKLAAEHGGIPADVTALLENTYAALKAKKIDLRTVRFAAADKETPVSMDAAGDGDDDSGPGAMFRAEVIEKFTTKHPGPDSYRWVKEQVAAFRAWERSAPGSDMSLEEWLTTNYRAATMRARNAI